MFSLEQKKAGGFFRFVLEPPALVMLFVRNPICYRRPAPREKEPHVMPITCPAFLEKPASSWAQACADWT